MKIEIELNHFNLDKAFDKAFDEGKSKLEDDYEKNDDYRSVSRLNIVHTGTSYFADTYRTDRSCYTFTFEVTEA